jgi:6-pyruvoyltetrahydropterin/6-carboxytetrahydropterin synthase
VSYAQLTRAVRFSAAHRYHRPDWSEERNRDKFGACANDPGHGHNYTCEVTVEGTVAKDTSMVLDLDTLDAILNDEVVKPLDHQHINFAVPEFAYGKTIPTAEALAVYLWGRIAGHLPPGVRLHRVRVREDTDLYAEFFGRYGDDGED